MTSTTATIPAAASSPDPSGIPPWVWRHLTTLLLGAVLGGGGGSAIMARAGDVSAPVESLTRDVEAVRKSLADESAKINARLGAIEADLKDLVKDRARDGKDIERIQGQVDTIRGRK